MRKPHPMCTSTSPADENSAPDLAILREDAQRQGKRYGFEDVLLIAEVVSLSSTREDYDDCTAKYGPYGIPAYVVVWTRMPRRSLSTSGPPVLATSRRKRTSTAQANYPSS